MADASTLALESNQIKLRILYDVEGLEFTVENEVVQSTSKTTVPRNVAVNNVWREIVVNIDGLHTENIEGTDRVLIDDLFWTEIGARAKQLITDGPIASVGTAWVCDWSSESVTFYSPDGNTPLTSLPIGQNSDAFVTKFITSLSVNVKYIDGITNNEIGTGTLTLDCNTNNTDIHQWEFNVPVGYYAAHTKFAAVSVAGYEVPSFCSTPSFFNWYGNFDSNFNIPRCLINNQPYAWEGHAVGTLCRDTAIMDTMGCIAYMNSNSLGTVTMQVTCYKTSSAPAEYKATYVHNIPGQPILLTTTPKTIYITKDHKTADGKTLFSLNEGACGAELQKNETVPSGTNPIHIERASGSDYVDNYDGTLWTCTAEFLAQAKLLIVKRYSTTNIGSEIVVHNDRQTINPLEYTYKAFFGNKQTVNADINGSTENVIVFLQYVDGVDDVDSQMDYGLLFNPNEIQVTAYYSADYEITVHFISNVGNSTNGYKFFPETRDEHKNSYEFATTTYSFTTEEDKLASTIKNLLDWDTLLHIEGKDTVYYVDSDCKIDDKYKVTVDSRLKQAMLPNHTWFHSPSEMGTSNLEKKLQQWIDEEITEVSISMIPHKPKITAPLLKWKLFSSPDSSASLTDEVSKRVDWLLYYGRNATYSDICNTFKSTISFVVKNKGEDVTIPSNQWNIDQVSNSTGGYYGTDISNNIFDYNATSEGATPTLYVSCLKLLEYSLFKINKKNGSQMTIYKEGNSVYQDYQLNIDKDEFYIANDLANNTLLKCLGDGAVIFLSDGADEGVSSTLFKDWPGYITEERADKVYYNGVVCNKALNVNQGLDVMCRFVKILGTNSSAKVNDILIPPTYLSFKEPKRQFLVAIVGAGGGGGGGQQNWFNSNGGSGGGGGGYSLYRVKISSKITPEELATLKVSWEGGVGGSYGGEGSNGSAGTQAKIIFSITRSNKDYTLVTFTAEAGGGGGCFAGTPGAGAIAPTAAASSGGEITLDKVIEYNGLPGCKAGSKYPKDSAGADIKGTEGMEPRYTKYFELRNVWIGYEMNKLFNNTGDGIPKQGGIQSYNMLYHQTATSNCTTEANIKNILNNSSEYSKYNIYQMLPGNFKGYNPLYSDDKYGGAGAPSICGPGAIFDSGEPSGYTDRPCPGCGGCGSGHWIHSGDDEERGRSGGNAMFAIFC